jgi:hypothetical protein
MADAIMRPPSHHARTALILEATVAKCYVSAADYEQYFKGQEPQRRGLIALPIHPQRQYVGPERRDGDRRCEETFGRRVLRIAVSERDRNRGRQRAQARYRADSCDRCGSEKHVERHHKDDNPLNNDPDNIQRLCVRCHMLEDGRAQKYWQKPKLKDQIDEVVALLDAGLSQREVGVHFGATQSGVSLAVKKYRPDVWAQRFDRWGRPWRRDRPGSRRIVPI